MTVRRVSISGYILRVRLWIEHITGEVPVQRLSTACDTGTVRFRNDAQAIIIGDLE